ncbi:ABC transporter ATP-binding protein [Veillonella criceti]|uniref:Glutathione import ATP-binding protein GsiA n=1 Tax=Veillonella criceti TaxID=103891 RepID=A0A380NM66_9FIRM|nr:ATP-binding cassette domain-containing protein [Veillonella criceti]SUP43150.1 Glutathione import ATP-binding protein GsiA [Veillonella criceti]
MQSSPWLLDLQDLTVSYHNQIVLQNLNLQLKPGECIAIVGPSGSGKTTLLRTLTGLLPQHSEVSYKRGTFAGVAWPKTDQAWHSLRGREIVYVPQEAQASLSPFKTIETQCCDVAKAIRLPWTEAQQRIAHLLQQLDLPLTVLQQRPSALSGGMAQRVVMLLALLPKPKLIVADEPAANLDVVRQQQMVTLLRNIRLESEVAVIFVTHQLELATHMSQTLYEMKEGQLQLLNSTDQVDRLRLNQVSIEAVTRNNSVTDITAHKSPLLLMKGVTVAYETEQVVLRDISITLQAGEWVALMGLSGAGKSTLFKTLLGEQPIAQGDIAYRGQLLGTFSKQELGRLVQPILQNPQSSFNPRQTIGWSIGEALRCQGKQKKNSNFEQSRTTMGKVAQTIDERIEDLLAQVHLPAAYRQRYPHELSGGECQRAALARALASEPDLLLCDEMTSALDPAVQYEIIEVLQAIRKQRPLGGLVITHDLRVAAALCERLYILEAGHIVEASSINDVLAQPQSLTAKQLVTAYSKW